MSLTPRIDSIESKVGPREMTTDGSDPGEKGVSSISISTFSNTTTTLQTAATLTLTTLGGPVMIALKAGNDPSQNGFINISSGSGVFELGYKLAMKVDGAQVYGKRPRIVSSTAELAARQFDPEAFTIVDLPAGTHTVTLDFAALSGGYAASQILNCKFSVYEL